MLTVYDLVVLEYVTLSSSDVFCCKLLLSTNQCRLVTEGVAHLINLVQTLKDRAVVIISRFRMKSHFGVGLTIEMQF